MKVKHVVSAAAAVATSPTEEIQEYEFPLNTNVGFTMEKS
jgi:hypothetical protein